MNLGQLLLWPLTLPYGAISRLRARAYAKGLLRHRRLKGVVISVGNITTGGTGKTPMVLFLAERLLAEGKKTAILTRGYRGENSATGSTSDEVQLLQRRLGDRVAFGIGADRFARGSELARRGIDWFILDDGFQHLQLARNVDIVLIDATNPFGGGQLLPAGRLREPKSAISRADIIVITRSRHAPAIEAAIRRESRAPIFYASVRLDSVMPWRSANAQREAPSLQGKKLFAFCGIGNPSAFVADLREWGFQIVAERFFPDHHRYTPEDIQVIESEARSAGADALICTEKDNFNLANAQFQSFDVSYCRISLQLDRAEEFWNVIAATIAARIHR
ncbi:MAG TPA: tetraacyldisaccharide 4'-kinase [Verrucomicrobiae bacterium]|nr:tetraacyldisaccharide 4'-kinase [Verrucomicrobiae bacterium]